MASIPIRVRGLKLYSEVEDDSYAFVTSRLQYLVLQDHIWRDIGIFGMNYDFEIALDGLNVKILDF